MRWLVFLVAALGPSCGPALSTPPPSTSYPSYQYTVTLPTTPLKPNEPLHLVWEPRLAGNRDSGIADVQLCVALFGPWETVDALKKTMAGASPRPTCPPAGAIVVSDTIRTTSSSGERFATDIVLPSVAGFYDVHQLSITSAGGASYSATNAGGIIEVRTR